MSATSRATESAPAPSDVAATLRGAPLVRILTRADGDAIAAAGVLARALAETGTPFQASPTPTSADRTERIERGDPDAVTVALGDAEGADVTLPAADPPLSTTAAEIARELGADPSPELALAGAVAAGELPGDAPDDLLEAARERGMERRPGVGVPTDDLAAGLAGSTLFHAPFSGDLDAAADALSDLGIDPDADDGTLDDDERRSVASLVAVEATGGPYPERAAETVERALRPHAIDGPFPTIEGYADVLDVTATVDPGGAIAHAIGGNGTESLLRSWREAAASIHGAIRSGDIQRYDGLVVATVGDAPAAIAARLVSDARSPEPIALAVGDDAAGIAARDGHDARPATAAVADATGGSADGSSRRGWVTHDGTVPEQALIETVREAL